MNLLRKINWLCTAILCIVLVTSCSDEETLSSSNGTGFLKLRLLPQTTTRATGLEYMTDAKKVEISLLYGDRPITQSLVLSSVANGADLGLESDKLELRAGEYKLLSYTLFSDVKPGAEAPEKLLTVYPEETILIQVTNGHITEKELKVKATVRGQVYFDITKDLSNFDEWKDQANKTARATMDRDEKEFNYDEIEEVDLYYRRKGTSEHASPHSFKVYSKKGEKYLHTDTTTLEAGEYEITRYMLYTHKRAELLLAADLKETYITVAPSVCQKTSFDVKFPANMYAMKDYFALYTIWINMKGPTEWSFNGDGTPAGANWRFKDRPVDEWGNQPGVETDSRGRVKSLDLGSFNAVGKVPEALGDLTALVTLYLGQHSDKVLVKNEFGAEDQYTLSRLALQRRGVDLAANRMSIAKERLSLLHPTPVSEIYETKKPVYKYATRTYDMAQGSISNRITGLPESVKNLTDLTFLFVANGYVDRLPDGLANLEKLTDVEFYNCRFKEFPEVLTKMQHVVSLNFSANSNIPADKLHDGINEFLLANKSTLQILYLTYCGLEKFPDNIRYSSKIALIDMAFNKLTELPSLNYSIAPVQAFFDNNKIKKMADDFCDTDDIESFSISNNLLTEFPDFFGKGQGASSKYSASSLNFADNKITHFKAGFKGVRAETLTLSQNQFGNRPGGTLKGRRSFPTDLSDTNSPINFLVINNCEIDTLHPKVFKNFKSLKALDLSGNRLRYIPWQFNVETLPYLAGLNLSMNSFTLFPLEVLNVQGLNKLYLNDQFDVVNGKEIRCMRQWPQGIYKHNGLKVLDVSGNNITLISETDFPFQLAAFNIANNPALEIHIPSVVCSSIAKGSFSLGFESSQNILGCPILDLDNNK